MTYIIYSFGRCGSTLLAQLISATIYTQEKTKPKNLDFKTDDYLYHDDKNVNTELLQNQKIIHTHVLDQRYTRLIKDQNNTIIFCTRRDIVETIASLLIAERVQQYNYLPGRKFKGKNMNNRKAWLNEPGQKLVAEDKIIESLISSYYNFINNRYPKCRKQNGNVQLLYYEDWIYDFSKLSFLNIQYNLELNSQLTKKIPIDKRNWVDYDLLTNQVKYFNKGSTQIEIQ